MIQPKTFCNLFNCFVNEMQSFLSIFFRFDDAKIMYFSIITKFIQ